MAKKDLLPITTERLVLRRPNQSDLVDFQAYRLDPEVARYQSWEQQSDEQALAFLAAVSDAALLEPGEWCQIGIALRESGKMIGDIGICVDAEGVSADSTGSQQAEIGFTLSRGYQGQGLASEAVRTAIEMVFANSSVSKIVGITDARNIASIRLLERLGMTRVETVNALFRGEPCVEFVFELLSDSA